MDSLNSLTSKQMLEMYEPNVEARIAICGDTHLNSKNYGAHRDYATESLEYFNKLTEVVRNKRCTHLIGSGDFSFGRFNTLEYRLEVERNLAEQYRLTNGNRYEICGNHDMVTYKMSERDYYIKRGLLKPSENITINNVNITMVDYGKQDKVEVNIVDDENHMNFMVAHDYYKFINTDTANFGNAILLDNKSEWFGLDCLICGHVHKIMDFNGYIQKDGLAHEVKVYYPGCMTRPSYREGYTDEEGQVIIITIYKDGKVDLDIERVELWSIEKAFNLELKAIEKAKKKEKEERVDIYDVVKQLDMHDRNVGNPEDIISGMEGIDERYKAKAIELLKEALA